MTQRFCSLGWLTDVCPSQVTKDTRAVQGARSQSPGVAPLKEEASGSPARLGTEATPGPQSQAPAGSGAEQGCGGLPLGARP